MRKITALYSIAIAAGVALAASAAPQSSSNAQLRQRLNAVTGRASSTQTTNFDQSKDSLEAIVKKASAGDPWAMNQVGLWYYSGEHYQRDYKKAAYWFELATREKNPYAAYNLGRCLRYGQGVMADSVKALNQYLLAIKLGNNAALEYCADEAPNSPFDAIVVGNCYERPIGVDQDYKKAAKYYAMAATKGSIDGNWKAGYCYYRIKEGAEALKFYQKAADMGNPEAAYWTGKLLLGTYGAPTDLSKAVNYLLKSADANNPNAQCELGKLYAEGKGVTRNANQAVSYYDKALENRILNHRVVAGNREAMWLYAMALIDGEGTAQNYSEAAYWLIKYAQVSDKTFERVDDYLKGLDQKNPFRSYVKGLRYLIVNENTGDATKEFKKVKNDDGNAMVNAALIAEKSDKSYAKAAKNLTKLATTNARAAYLLAGLYAEGHGVERDMAKAIKLYIYAAQNGFAPAADQLGNIYYEGIGVDKNLNEAGRYYRLAFANSSIGPNGLSRLAEFYKKGEGGIAKDESVAASLAKFAPAAPCADTLRKLGI